MRNQKKQQRRETRQARYDSLMNTTKKRRRNSLAFFLFNSPPFSPMSILQNASNGSDRCFQRNGSGGTVNNQKQGDEQPKPNIGMKMNENSHTRIKQPLNSIINLPYTDSPRAVYYNRLKLVPPQNINQQQFNLYAREKNHW